MQTEMDPSNHKPIPDAVDVLPERRQQAIQHLVKELEQWTGSFVLKSFRYRDDDSLHLMLEHPDLPEPFRPTQVALVKVIHEALSACGDLQVRAVAVYGQVQGQPKPSWKKTFVMGSSAKTAMAPSPGQWDPVPLLFSDRLTTPVMSLGQLPSARVTVVSPEAQTVAVSLEGPTPEPEKNPTTSTFSKAGSPRLPWILGSLGLLSVVASLLLFSNREQSRVLPDRHPAQRQLC